MSESKILSREEFLELFSFATMAEQDMAQLHDAALRARIAELERDQDLRSKYAADVVAKGGCWFYAPCSNCGAIEGMGLSSNRKSTVAVWCCACHHFGPVVEGIGKEHDRSAVAAWNSEFFKTFAELAALRAETSEKETLEEIDNRD